jgi:hypothetical protein
LTLQPPLQQHPKVALSVVDFNLVVVRSKPWVGYYGAQVWLLHEGTAVCTIETVPVAGYALHTLCMLQELKPALSKAGPQP